jgi:amino acid transporter
MYESSSSPKGTNEKEGDIQMTSVDHDYGADTDLKRTLSTRHITMIALGSSIGMGLWLGSGSSLASGGPAAMFIGYILSGTMIWAVSHSIGEMAIMYPLPSAFVQWSSIFISEPAGFTLGWAYWFGYWITLANELQVSRLRLVECFHAKPDIGCGYRARLLDGQSADSCVDHYLLGSHNLGQHLGRQALWRSRGGRLDNQVLLDFRRHHLSDRYVFSLCLEYGLIQIVVSAGGAPNHDPIGFRYWNAMPFTHGFKGFLSVMPTCIFAMSGSEYTALVAAETSNPRKSVPRAVGSIWMRLSLFYIMGSLMVTITVSPKDPNLFGSGLNASPFVIAYKNAGLMPLAHMMNAVVFISVLSTGSIQVYAGARTLMGLSHLKMAPKVAPFASTIYPVRS